MSLRTIHELKDLKGKRILLRVDLNSDVMNGRVTESSRIRAHAETIKFLIKKKAKIVILAHQGTPGKKDCISLKQHAKFLNKYVKIKFINQVIGKKTWFAINSMKDGEALLLENVRFLKSEMKPSVRNDFADFMKELGFDYYIADAFSILHRNQTSITAFPKIFPHAIGLVLAEELKNVEKIKSKMKNCLFILGGAKSKDVVALMQNHKILTTGKPALLALIAKNVDLGFENRELKKDICLIDKFKKNLKNIKTPGDLAVSVNLERKDFPLSAFPEKFPVYDIGKNTIKSYAKIIKKLGKNKAIFFKGSPGRFEYKNFDLGTRGILKAISESSAFSVIAGGQSSDALSKFRIDKKKFGYVSFSGGSLVHFLAGEKLVGLSALR